MNYPKVEYTIGSESYVQVTGPEASYYTSCCTRCLRHASTLYEWPRSMTSGVDKLCFECYEAEVLHSARARRVQPETGEKLYWADYAFSVVSALLVTIIIGMVIWMIVKVYG